MVLLTDIAAAKPATACKVCGRQALLYGVADFNKNCEEPRGVLLPLSGVPVYYHQCQSCKLVFTEALDHWGKTDYLEHIYNDRYIDVDPDYVEIRPGQNAEIVARFLAPRPDITHIDYGGGNGVLARRLNEAGFTSSSWDPMDTSATYPAGRFGFVTAFEVFEHTPLPRETLQEILRLCDASAPLILFSTLTVDQLAPRAMDLWYIAPRNGHITIHTESSLQVLFQSADMAVHHFGNGWHLAFKALPPWLDLTIFERLARGTLVHRIAVACGLHRQGRLRRLLQPTAA